MRTFLKNNQFFYHVKPLAVNDNACGESNDYYANGVPRSIFALPMFFTSYAIAL